MLRSSTAPSANATHSRAHHVELLKIEIDRLQRLLSAATITITPPQSNVITLSQSNANTSSELKGKEVNIADCNIRLEKVLEEYQRTPECAMVCISIYSSIHSRTFIPISHCAIVIMCTSKTAAHTFTRIHTHIHTRAQAHMHMHARTHTHPLHTRARTHSRKRTFTCTRTHAHNAHMHVHARTHTAHARKRTFTCTRTHAPTPHARKRTLISVCPFRNLHRCVLTDALVTKQKIKRRSNDFALDPSPCPRPPTHHPIYHPVHPLLHPLHPDYPLIHRPIHPPSRLYHQYPLETHPQVHPLSHPSHPLANPLAHPYHPPRRQ